MDMTLAEWGEWIIGLSIVAIHAILVLAMLALWIVRKMTGTWRCLNGFMNDWDIAQKGAVLHGLGVLGMWGYIGCIVIGAVSPQAIGQLMMLPIFAGIAVAFIGFGAFVVTFVDTLSDAPAKKLLGRCAKTTFSGMASMIALAFCSGGSPNPPVVLLAMFACAAVMSVLGAIACFATVFWFSLAEHREILRTGGRARY